MIEYLDPVEARVMGALAEKSITVKEQYPLTFNALLLACNQKSNRDPVMNLDANALGKAVDGLIGKILVRRSMFQGERVPKYYHNMDGLIDSEDPKVTGIFIVLLLRGPQTAGEIKSRSERFCSFESVAEVEGLLLSLASAEEPMVMKLPRAAGQQADRYAHLFCGVPEIKESPNLRAEGPAVYRDRVGELEIRLAALEELVRKHEALLKANEALLEKPEPAASGGDGEAAVREGSVENKKEY